MVSIKILVTGATGYVGGTVLNTLLGSNDGNINAAIISALVRAESQAQLLEAKGVRAIIFQGFEDHITLRRVASEHDVVVHTASGFHADCARSLIMGLADRKSRYGKDVYYLHASGTTSLADSPRLNLYRRHPEGVFSDQYPEKVVMTLKQLNEDFGYPQRTTDLTVIATGSETGVRTIILMLPMLYGAGSGFFNTSTGQVTMIIREAMKDGHISIVGDGTGVKGHVHIRDAACLFELVVSRILGNEELAYGDEGILFVENGHHNWEDVGKGLAQAGYKLGQLKTPEVKSLELNEAVTKLDWKSVEWTELAFVSSSRVSAEKARSYGWVAQNGDEEFHKHYEEEWKAAVSRKGEITGSGRG